jgi:hypothetical protein
MREGGARKMGEPGAIRFPNRLSDFRTCVGVASERDGLLSADSPVWEENR